MWRDYGLAYFPDKGKVTSVKTSKADDIPASAPKVTVKKLTIKDTDGASEQLKNYRKELPKHRQLDAASRRFGRESRVACDLWRAFSAKERPYCSASRAASITRVFTSARTSRASRVSEL